MKVTPPPKNVKSTFVPSSHQIPTAAIWGLGVWTPDFPGTSAWISRTPTTPPAQPRGTIIPPMLRRRISPLTAAMMDALTEASTKADLSTCAAVFASAHGETSVLEALLEQMTTQQPTLSPVAFASSVHNTASGLLSIATHNRGISTSLAAGHDTVAAAFIEALGILHDGATDVLVVAGDLAEPNRLVDASERASLVSVAFHLKALHSANEVEGDTALIPPDSRRLMGVVGNPQPLALMTWPVRDLTIAPPKLGIKANLERSPCVGALNLADAITRRSYGTVRLDGGAGDAWCTTLSFPEF